MKKTKPNSLPSLHERSEAIVQNPSLQANTPLQLPTKTSTAGADGARKRSFGQSSPTVFNFGSTQLASFPGLHRFRGLGTGLFTIASDRMRHARSSKNIQIRVQELRQLIRQ